MTQNRKILKYLTQNGYITTMDAFEQLKITRLSARVKEIEDMGIELLRFWKSNRNTRWLEYHLQPKDIKRVKAWLKGGDGLRQSAECSQKQ